MSELRYAEIGRDARRAGGGPLYLRLADQLADRIENGQLMAGEALPPQRRLCDLLEVGEVTARRALAELARRGLVRARQGSGTVITGWMPAPLRTTRRRAVRELQIGVLSVAAADGYPFIQPFLKALAAARPALPDAPAMAVRMLFRPGEDTAEHAEALLDELDGLIQMSPVSLQVLAACQQRGLPYVLLFNELVDGHSTCIWTDYGPGLLAAVRHLHHLGRQRIALVTAHPDRFSSGRMADALALAMAACDLPSSAARIVAAGYSASQGQRITEALLRETPRPQAILYASEHQAHGGRTAIAAAGLRIPDDLIVITATGAPIDPADRSYPEPRIDLNTQALAQATHDALLAQHHRTPWPRRTAIPSRWVL